MAGEPRRHFDGNEMAMLLGQLVQATESASKGLEALSREARDNATALAAAARTLEIVEAAVNDLTNLVKDGGDEGSVVAQLRSLRSTNENLRNSIDAINKDVSGIRKTVDDFQIKKHRLAGGWDLLMWLGAFLGWVIGTALAVYEVFKK
jgi:chromosome segregation ATPase